MRVSEFPSIFMRVSAFTLCFMRGSEFTVLFHEGFGITLCFTRVFRYCLTTVLELPSGATFQFVSLCIILRKRMPWQENMIVAMCFQSYCTIEYIIRNLTASEVMSAANPDAFDPGGMRAITDKAARDAANLRAVRVCEQHHF